jgi:predicted ATP-binding protein involved in virulence
MVLKMEDGPRLFSMLSAGQRVMLLMVLDIAVRSVSQNAHMLKGDEYYKVITDTPGVILIDELDVHLHPSWQRLVAAGLKNIFQAMQFVCTTHSPQMIGELMPNEVLIFEDGTLIRPSQSYGLDSNFILNQYMNTNERDQDVKDAIFLVKKMIAQGSISQAEDEINRWIAKLGGVIGPFQQELAKIQKVKLLRG